MGYYYRLSLIISRVLAQRSSLRGVLWLSPETLEVRQDHAREHVALAGLIRSSRPNWSCVQGVGKEIPHPEKKIPQAYPRPCWYVILILFFCLFQFYSPF